MFEIIILVENFPESIRRFALNFKMKFKDTPNSA